MGTIGGSISFADPGLDYPPAIVAADAWIEIAGVAQRRRVAAADFFVDWYTTALEPGEIVTAVILTPKTGGAAYVKHARVASDYATASAARLHRRRKRGPRRDRLAAARRRSATTPPTPC